MPNSGDDRADLARTVGLCARCLHAARQETARGSVFFRCRRAECPVGMDYLVIARKNAASLTGRAIGDELGRAFGGRRGS